MKIKNQYHLLMVLSFFLFWSCSEDGALEDMGPAPDHNEAHIQKIKNSDVSVENLQEYEDYYIAEGDIMFLKEELDHEHKGPVNEQARTTYLVAPAYWNIKVYLDESSFSTVNLNTAVNDAIASINAVGSGISISRVYSSSQANITIRNNNFLAANTCGSAGFPSSSGRPFSRVDINESLVSNAIYQSGGRLTLLVAHELGHCIGLRHTNWASRSESFALTIPGTPSSDGSSVMNGGTCGATWAGWSFYDKVALKTLYSTTPNKGDNLVPGEQLTTNQSITSTDNRFSVVMQSDGNLVLYKYNIPLWASNTSGKPVTKCIMQTDGNLVLYDNSYRAYWNSGTANTHNAFAVIQNDGNFVIYQAGTAFWDSGTGGM